MGRWLSAFLIFLTQLASLSAQDWHTKAMEGLSPTAERRESGAAEATHSKIRSESVSTADSQQQRVTFEEDSHYDDQSDTEASAEPHIVVDDSERRDHRLLLQALITAIVISMCGMITILAHSVSFLGFLLFQERSIGTRVVSSYIF